VDATFAAFGIEAVYTPAGGEPVSVRVITRRPDTIVGFGETRIHAETPTFEVRASEVANRRSGHQLTVGGEAFVIQGEPEFVFAQTSGGTPQQAQNLVEELQCLLQPARQPVP
jgi:hypothetical protein